MKWIFILIWACATALAQLPDGEGKALTQKVCNNCHGPENYENRRLTKDGWEEVIQAMVGKGAQASDAEFDAIVDYLSRNLGPKVNVNKSAAKEIEASLDLSTEEAAAIVRFREKNGAFKSLDDLKRVPGVDPKKIEARKTQIDF